MRLYVKFHQEAEKNQLEDEARSWFARWKEETNRLPSCGSGLKMKHKGI